MGRFINGVHQSWTSELGPNERFGVEDDMSFNELATKLENRKRQEKNNIQNTTDSSEFNKIISSLEIELANYSKYRNNCINLIRNLIKNYPQKNIESDIINELISNDIAIKKLIEYYVKHDNS